MIPGPDSALAAVSQRSILPAVALSNVDARLPVRALRCIVSIVVFRHRLTLLELTISMLRWGLGGMRSGSFRVNVFEVLLLVVSLLLLLARSSTVPPLHPGGPRGREAATPLVGRAAAVLAGNGRLTVCLLAGVASIDCTAASASWPTLGVTAVLRHAGGWQLGPYFLCAVAALALGSTDPRETRSGIRRLAAPIHNGLSLRLSASAWAPLQPGNADGGGEEDGRREESMQARRLATEEKESSVLRPQVGATRGS